MRHSIMPAPKILRLMPCLCAAAAAVVLMTAQAAAQNVTDTVRVLFRVDAPAASTVKAAIAAANASACTGDSAAVTPKTAANARDTLTLLIGPGPNSALRGQHGQDAPATVSYSRGSVSLKLRAQQYGGANVSLYTVNGRRILNNKISASSGAHSVSRSNLPAGAYMLSVKGTNGNAFTAKLAHSGGKLNINVTFGGEDFSLGKQAAEHCGVWTMTLSAAAGYHDTTHTVGIDAAGVIDIGTVALRALPAYPLTVNTYPPNGGTVARSVEQDSYTQGTAVTLTARPAAGYTFFNWSGALNATDSAITVTVDGALTLTASFVAVGSTVKQFAVSFDRNGGTSAAISPVEVDSGTTLGTRFPAAPTRTGYTFDGWFEGTKQYTASTEITKDTELTAKWTLKRFTVTFDLNGGTSAGINPVAVDSGSSLGAAFPANPSRALHDFAGWFEENGTTRYEAVTIITKDIKLLARWTVSTWTLTANIVTPDGVIAGVGGTVSVNEAVYTAPTPLQRESLVSIRATPNNATPLVNKSLFSHWTASPGLPAGIDTLKAFGTFNISSNITLNAYFTPDSSFIDRRTNQVYFVTKTIGGQVWMRENLNYRIANGTGSWCYDDDPENCKIYGRLYNWATVMGFDPACNTSSCAGQIKSPHQGICPAGWHVPSYAEWQELIDFVGTNAGTKLKTWDGWHEYSGVPYGTNDYRFQALPGGRRTSDGNFLGVGSQSSWWIAKEVAVVVAEIRYLSHASNDVNIQANTKSTGLSVRCVRDD